MKLQQHDLISPGEEAPQKNGGGLYEVVSRLWTLLFCSAAGKPDISKLVDAREVWTRDECVRCISH
jgi:hypothetical protein